MNVTQFSFMILPLCLFWALKPVRLLQLMVIAAVFESAAALTFGSLGLQPGLIPAGMFLGFIALQLLLGADYPGSRNAWHMARPFVIVSGWAVVSSVIMPRIFEGRVYVWPQKSEPPFVQTVLAPTAGNINQDFYLVINCCLVVLASMFLTKSSVRLRPMINAYLFTGFLASALSVWQLANKLGGVPYPNDLLYSNPGWALLTGQQIGIVPRINGPFAEPSSLAGYMAAIVCSCGWVLVQGHENLMARMLLIVGILAMILSTSTTGFGVLAIVGCGLPIYAFGRGDTRLLSSVMKIGVPLMIVGALMVFTASVVEPAILTNAQDVIDATMDKQGSSSYQDRTGADVDSLVAFQDSFGLGVGWGSNRSSSFIPGLLASLGLPGAAGLVWFVFVLTQRVRRARRVTPSRDLLFVIDACCGALVGYVLPALIAGPTISSVTFFYLLAVLVGAVATVEIGIRDNSAKSGRPSRISG